jgi:suppressor of tumorigenicity protein 13
VLLFLLPQIANDSLTRFPGVGCFFLDVKSTIAWLFCKHSAKEEVPVEEEAEEDLDTPTPEVEHIPLVIPGDETLEPEDTTAQEMGDASAAPDDDASGKSQEAFTKGQEALGSRDFAGAIASFTEAIKLDATGTRPFAMRAKAHIKLKKPVAALKDADAVLAINPDNAAGYKWRGKANAMLGNWINAFEDLSKALSIDFDDEAADMLPDVKKNAMKMKEDVRTFDRLTKERDTAERVRRNKKAKRDYAQANAASSSSASASGGMPGGFPGGGMPDMSGMGGGMPGGMPAGMAGLFSDPDVMASMSDPDIMAAMADMQGNPANLMKHMSNPKVAAFFQKMQGKMGGMGGMGGGMPGGMGGMPGGMPDMGGGFEDVTDEPAPPAAAAPPPSMDDID